MHREAISTKRNSEGSAEGESEQSKALLNELMSYPGIAEVWHPSARTTQNTMLLTVHLKRGDLELEFFSTIATLGTPYDITLQELRIECLFPANDNTEHNWEQILKS
ncbi:MULTISPECIES: hypothetical protein [unclassified Leptolyngbya]|uniref:MmyB family transcriptional regulator n=1 Tax=unclassified Leptolyngbya TaxID=2650499 RepID=UPI001687631C|nr:MULTISPECIES: hypothetical protein [unclassified Leptolyngbya]MBD1909022.1 hypothetical protein [Leptolyngbya sp. FACHB-8]MBD2158078.1 hypothetical protein [Leptolyngbya sp. FACHB-16]